MTPDRSSAIVITPATSGNEAAVVPHDARSSTVPEGETTFW